MQYQSYHQKKTYTQKASQILEWWGSCMWSVPVSDMEICVASLKIRSYAEIWKSQHQTYPHHKTTSCISSRGLSKYILNSSWRLVFAHSASFLEHTGKILNKLPPGQCSSFPLTSCEDWNLGAPQTDLIFFLSYYLLLLHYTMLSSVNYPESIQECLVEQNRIQRV